MEARRLCFYNGWATWWARTSLEECELEAQEFVNITLMHSMTARLAIYIQLQTNKDSQISHRLHIVSCKYMETEQNTRMH